MQIKETLWPVHVYVWTIFLRVTVKACGPFV